MHNNNGVENNGGNGIAQREEVPRQEITRDEEIPIGTVLGYQNVEDIAWTLMERWRIEERERWDEIERRLILAQVILDAGSREVVLARIDPDVTPIRVWKLLVRGGSGDYPFPSDAEGEVGTSIRELTLPLDDDDPHGHNCYPYWLQRELETAALLQDQITEYGVKRLTLRFDAEYGEKRHALKMELRTLGLGLEI